MVLKKSDLFKLVNYCEIDKYASRAYAHIHGVDESLNLGDISKVNPDEIADFDMICGGPPCQDLSVAGRGLGAVYKCNDCGYEYDPMSIERSDRKNCPKCLSENISKTRSSLLVDYLRIIEAKKPKFGIWENVKNFAGSKFKDTFNACIKELENYGYNVYWKVLNAKDYGIPQNRERVFIVFIRKDVDNGKFKFGEPFDSGLRLKDFMEAKTEDKYYLPETEELETLIQEAIKNGKLPAICE